MQHVILETLWKEDGLSAGDIERPIVQGGLMWVVKAELTSADANAGGIGFMTAFTFHEAEDLRAEIRRSVAN